jgi:hypothetical protein
MYLLADDPSHMGSGTICNEMLYCKDYMPKKAPLGLLEIERQGGVFIGILGKVGLSQQ